MGPAQGERHSASGRGRFHRAHRTGFAHRFRRGARASEPLDRSADALLAIDQHRASVVERIVDSWGAALAKSSAYVSIDELRTRLLSLRADRLLNCPNREPHYPG